MTEDKQPDAGDPKDPRALALAQARQQSLHRKAPYNKPVPSWDELTERQRTARIATAAEWIQDAFFANLLPLSGQRSPSEEQFAALESFLSARCEEIRSAMRGAIIPRLVSQAADMLCHRIFENTITVGLAMRGVPEENLGPSWSPRAQNAWTELLRCAERFCSHDDYAPAAWMP